MSLTPIPNPYTGRDRQPAPVVAAAMPAGADPAARPRIVTTPDLHAVPVLPLPDCALLASSLSAEEIEICLALRIPKRQSEWLAGRIAAKELIRERYRLTGPDALRVIEIRNLHEGPERGRPFYRINGTCGPYSLSISHSGHIAMAGLAHRAGDRLGMDVEAVERRGASFESIALSQDELRQLAGWCGASRWRVTTRMWVLKEALLKALGVGLRVPLTQLTVHGAVSEFSTTWEFEVSPDARDRYPSLAEVGRVPMAVSAFEIEDLMGAWVVLAAPEEPCSRS